MKIFLHYNREDWIIDRMAMEFQSRWPDVISKSVESCDLIWSLSPKILRHPTIPIITMVHHVDPTKYDSSFYKAMDLGTSHYITFCNKTKEVMESLPEFTKSINVLPYWVNTDLWKESNKDECRVSLSLSKEKYIIGSFQRDTEGNDLISPKLSKGPDRFCDYVEKVQAQRGDVHVLLGGWRRQYVISRLKRADIPFTYIERPPIATVNTMYNACDLYVVGSRYEGGPQSILECAITKTPIVSTDVGIAKDILSPKCIIDIEKDMYTPNDSDLEYAYSKALELSLEKDLGHVSLFKSLVK